MSRYITYDLTPEERRALYDATMRQNAAIRFPAVERSGYRTNEHALEHAEELLREMRVRLGQANLCERRGEIELADAYGAVAANKLARAIRIAGNVIAL